MDTHSPRINTDQNGAVTTRHDYLPFGEEIDGTGGRTTGLNYGDDSVRQKFTGKERDDESGLDYFDARYYSSKLGRFINPDEFTGGPDELFDFVDDATDNPTFYADLDNPQSLNKYQYTYNNPYRYVDPDGHEVDESCCFVVSTWVDVLTKVTVEVPARGITKGLTDPSTFGDPVSITALPPGAIERDDGSVVDSGGRVIRPSPYAPAREGSREGAGIRAQPQARPTANLAKKATTKSATRAPGGVKTGKTLTDKQAVERLRRGQDTKSSSRAKAKELQKKTNRGAVRDPAHKPRFKPHYHGKGRTGGHSFYDEQ